MVPPLDPTFANVFLIYHEKNWLEHCPLEYRPLYYRRYVHYIFVLFNSAEHLKRLHSYLNSCHLIISFTIENEKDDLAEFIPIFTVSYHPVTKLACYIHYYIDVSGFPQIGPSFTQNWLIDVFKSNGYPKNFINNCLKCFWTTNIEYKKN